MSCNSLKDSQVRPWDPVFFHWAWLFRGRYITAPTISMACKSLSDFAMCIMEKMFNLVSSCHTVTFHYSICTASTVTMTHFSLFANCFKRKITETHQSFNIQKKYGGLQAKQRRKETILWYSDNWSLKPVGMTCTSQIFLLFFFDFTWKSSFSTPSIVWLNPW